MKTIRFLLSMLTIVSLMASCNNDDDLFERTDKAFSNLRFNAQEVGSDQNFDNWNEWVTRYMWDFKGVIEVRYDATTEQYYVDGKQLQKYGYYVSQDKYKLYDLYNLGFDFPKTGEPFQIYAAGDILNDLFRVFDYFVWSNDSSNYPVTKAQDRNSNGEYLDWKSLGLTESECLNGIYFINTDFNGTQEWEETYQGFYHNVLTVKYSAAIDAFVAYPKYGTSKQYIMFVLMNYNPKDKKDSSLFDIYVAGRLKDCNKRMHEQDARLYKYLDVVDSFSWEDRNSYHKPKGK